MHFEYIIEYFIASKKIRDTLLDILNLFGVSYHCVPAPHTSAWVVPEFEDTGCKQTLLKLENFCFIHETNENFSIISTIYTIH